ncbi:MAG: acyl-CoA dehydrogenase [Caulobacteraceae bacterium]|nr:acyl-CoA dehydrogenase [Caulobacteraceae bacterium]
MWTPEQEEIARTVRRLFKDRSAARKPLEGGPAVDPALWGQLAELGLTGVSLPEAVGGSGLGLAEECVAAEALGAWVAPVPVVSTYLAGHILAGGAGEAAARVGAQLASGEKVVGAGLSSETGVPQNLKVEDGRLSGEVDYAFEAAAHDVWLAPADGAWWAVDLAGAGVERTEIASLDPTRRMAKLVFAGAPAEKVGALDFGKALALAQTLIAAEALGCAQTALDMASDYAKERKQFGQPIGRFQAIKHKLADMLVKTEAARSALWGALRSVRDGDPDPMAAVLAKSEATGAAAFVAAEATQVFAAMAITWEFDMHLLLRRAKHCQLSLGSPDEHLRTISATLLEGESGGRSAREGGDLDLGFVPSPEDEAFIQPLRDWLDAYLTPEKAEQIRRGGLAARREFQGAMADAGWVGIHWPKAWGGRDATLTQQIMFYAEITARGLPLLPGNRGLMLIGPALIAHGTPEQQALIEPTRRADILWSGGFSERGAGSDLAGLQTRGVVDGDELVINGHKIWTSHAHFADYLYVLVRTDPAAPKHQGISVVIVPAKAPGVEIRPLRRISGDFDFNEIFFDNVRVPLTNLIGPINKGWQTNRTTMVGEHLTNFLGAQAAQATNMHRIVRALAKREARLGVDPDLRRRVAEAWSITQVVKLHGLRNVARYTGGAKQGGEGSIQKLAGQEQEKRLGELLVDVQGAAGMKEAPTTRAYLATRASTIGGGTSEIHRNKMAERMLGMPRDLWADDEAGAR